MARPHAAASYVEQYRSRECPVIATDQMKEIYEQIVRPSPEGRRALATIISTKGSTPRKVGAKMLVFPDGRFLGTIGGGCGESDVFHEAVRVIEDGQSRVMQVDLTADEAGESGDVCGGIMEVFVEPV
jgi:xanthine dehydrogenase accessory factor